MFNLENNGWFLNAWLLQVFNKNLLVKIRKTQNREMRWASTWAFFDLEICWTSKILKSKEWYFIFCNYWAIVKSRASYLPCIYLMTSCKLVKILSSFTPSFLAILSPVINISYLAPLLDVPSQIGEYIIPLLHPSLQEWVRLRFFVSL